MNKEDIAYCGLNCALCKSKWADIRQKAAVLEEVSQPILGKAVEIAGLLVQVPEERGGVDGIPAPLEDSVRFPESFSRLLQMFQNRGAEDGVNGLVIKWNMIRGANQIHMG